MYIAVNTIEHPNPEMMKQMFRQSASKLASLEGFKGFELWTEGNRLKAVSRWENKAAFEAYLHSDTFAQSHGGGRGDEMRAKAQVEYFEAEVLA